MQEILYGAVISLAIAGITYLLASYMSYEPIARLAALTVFLVGFPLYLSWERVEYEGENSSKDSTRKNAKPSGSKSIKKHRKKGKGNK